MMDYFMKWFKACALPNHEAETVAGVIVNVFFTCFGVLAELYMYQGHKFESRVFCECCELLGVRKTMKLLWSRVLLLGPSRVEDDEGPSSSMEDIAAAD